MREVKEGSQEMNVGYLRFHLCGKIHARAIPQVDGTFNVYAFDSTSKAIDSVPVEAGISSFGEAKRAGDRLVNDHFPHECDSTTCGEWIEGSGA